MKTSPAKFFFLACCILAVAAIPSVFAYGDDEADQFMKMDTDGDGFVTHAEANAAGEAKFARADTNHDGFLTAAELTAANAADGSNAKHAKMAASAWITKSDTDGDGQLTVAEASAAGNAMFNQMDTDHDGKITQAECKDAHQKTKRNDKNNQSE